MTWNGYDYGLELCHSANTKTPDLIPLFIDTALAPQNRDLGVETIYQAAAKKNYRSVVVFNQFVGKKINNKLIKWKTPSPEDKYDYICDVEDFDREMIEEAIESAHDSLPNILTLYFAGLDHKSHCLGFSEQKDYLKDVIDSQIKNFVVGVWGEVSKIPDDVVFIIVSDHGHSPVSNDDSSMIEVKDISKEVEKDKRFRIAPDSVLFDAKVDTSNIVISVNGGMLHIYVRQELSKLRTPLGNSWSKLPRFNEDILPVAKAVISAQNNLGNFILQRNGEPFILVKDTKSKSYMYYRKSGDTVTLKYAEEEGLLSQEEVKKIESLYSKYSGDILIFANYDDNSSQYDFYTGSSLYCGIPKVCPRDDTTEKYLDSDHGNINLNDRHIPFVICGKAIETDVIEEANQVDVAPTIAEILGFTMPNIDGESIVEVDNTTGRIKKKAK